MISRPLFFLSLMFMSFAANAADEPVKIREYKTVYEFLIDRKSQSPVVQEHSSMVLEAQRSNAMAVIASFYDENSSILKAQAFTERNRRYNPNKVCGNYEVGGIFYSDAQLCTYRIPLERKGQQNSLEISKQFDNLRYFTQVYFPFYYEVEERIIEFHIPEWLDISLEEFNFPTTGIEKKEFKQKGVKVIQYRQKGLKSFESGVYMPGKSHTYPHIIPHIKSVTQNGRKQNLLSSADDLYAWYAVLVKEIGNEQQAIEAKTKELTENQSTDLDKIKSIYYWVQDNIRYIAFEEGIAGFKPEACQRVFQQRYGDCKGMANLTKEMLQLAGYDARLAWIGTNTLAYTYNTPSLAVDNHMICVVLYQGDTLILDATEKFISLQDSGERIQGKEMMIEQGDTYLIHKVPVYKADRNKKISRYRMVLKEEVLQGKGQISLNGEQKTALLYHCNNVRNEGSENLIKRFISGDNKNFSISGLDYSSLEDRENPFSIDFNFELQNKISGYGNELYWQADPVPEFQHLKVTEDRINILDFNEKMDRLTEVELSLPAGYNVSFVPAPLKEQHQEFSIRVEYEKKGNKLLYRRHIQVPSGKISVASFVEWNQALKNLEAKYKEQVVLTKK